ncbi:MAG: hypothetical protein JRI23_12680 [Deltaproteobacteria bacterium]|jgi:hypothetical protein|nr:hypothetical protein [Deltaproteobacteria bacterium]MBW2532570.1 hypothetical protein [Deltaproteobacteria bacterium]
MPARELARIVDPGSLDDAAGSRAKVQVVVPPGWLAERAEVELELPAMLCCARCDGGGCDRCNRSGAVRLDRAADRTLRFTLPDQAAGAILRLVQPLDDCDLDQLLVEVRPGNVSSSGVNRLPPPTAPSAAEPSAEPRSTVVAIAIAAALAALIAALAAHW